MELELVWKDHLDPTTCSTHDIMGARDTCSHAFLYLPDTSPSFIPLLPYVAKLKGRPGDRPMSVHQKFNAMVGIQREASREEEIQVLDSLNDDPLLRLHYGLHVTFQVRYCGALYSSIYTPT